MQGGNLLNPASAAQCADAVLMVRPRHFAFNAETALTNRFQEPGGSEQTAAQARAEFDAFATALAGEGVRSAWPRIATSRASRTPCFRTIG